MNRSDAEHSEFNDLASNDTENTEIVEGDEGNLSPVRDFDAEDTDLVVVQPDIAPEIVNQEIVEPQDVVPASGDEQVSVVGVDVLNVTEEVVTEQKTLQLPQQVSGWQRVQRFFMGSFAEDIARLNNLTQAIEDAPESSVNYVLRAELYMKMREYALAQLDFQRAYELAETHFELADWGLLEQVMRDRALTGLEKVQRRLR